MSPGQEKFLREFDAFVKEHGRYPTYLELTRKIECASTNSVTQYYKQLSKRGYFEKTDAGWVRKKKDKYVCPLCGSNTHKNLQELL